MYSTEIKVRVRYAEVDQMGIVYYGHYATYYEIARIEALRRIGVPYTEVEKRGIFMPVVSLEIRYLRPASYDDLLTIRVSIPQRPQVRIGFHYEVFHAQGTLLQTGKTDLVFVDKERGKPTRIPEFLVEKFDPYF